MLTVGSLVKGIFMKFDVVVGNPPYQETKGNTKNIDIWPLFVKLAVSVGRDVSLIHPGRWVVPKKNMQRIRDDLMSYGLTSFVYFDKSVDIFANTSIDGGVTITNFSDTRDINTPVLYYVGRTSDSHIYNCDAVFITNQMEQEILDKLYSKFGLNYPSMLPYVRGNIGSLGSSEFGYSKQSMIGYLVDDANSIDDPIKIWANNRYGKGTRFAWHYISKSYLNLDNYAFVSKRSKVMIDKKGNSIITGKGNVINNLPVIVDAETTASGDVLFIIPHDDSRYDLELIQSMFMTKTIRFIMTILQKDLYVRGFEYVPDYRLFVDYLNGSLLTDPWLYQFLGLSDDLIAHIEAVVSPK